MALRAGYQGFKKLLPGLKLFRPGCLGIDNSELSKTFFPRSEQAVLGAKNILPIYLSDLKSSLTTGWTWSGNTVSKDGITFTFTVENDIVTAIALSGTSTAQVDLNVTFTMKETGMFRANGGIPETYGQLHLYDVTEGNRPYTNATKTTIQYDVSHGSDDVLYYLEKGHSIMCTMRVFNGKTPTGQVFYPMIRLGSDPDPTFASYAMTNKELTDAIGRELSVSELTYTNCEYVAGGYVVSGNICTITLRVKATANLGISISGLPYAKISNNSNYISAIMHKVGGAITDSIPAYCTPDGLLSAFQNAVNDADYLVSASYLVR